MFNIYTVSEALKLFSEEFIDRKYLITLIQLTEEFTDKQLLDFLDHEMSGIIRSSTIIRNSEYRFTKKYKQRKVIFINQLVTLLIILRMIQISRKDAQKVFHRVERRVASEAVTKDLCVLDSIACMVRTGSKVNTRRIDDIVSKQIKRLYNRGKHV